MTRGKHGILRLNDNHAFQLLLQKIKSAECWRKEDMWCKIDVTVLKKQEVSRFQLMIPAKHQPTQDKAP